MLRKMDFFCCIWAAYDVLIDPYRAGLSDHWPVASEVVLEFGLKHVRYEGRQ